MRQSNELRFIRLDKTHPPIIYCDPAGKPRIHLKAYTSTTTPSTTLISRSSASKHGTEGRKRKEGIWQSQEG